MLALKSFRPGLFVCLLFCFFGQPMCSFDPVACSSTLHALLFDIGKQRRRSEMADSLHPKLKNTADYKIVYKHSSGLHWHILLHYTALTSPENH